ncbi:hypothetical protein D3OALGA1CA_2103 [Olavius algarvensis associated proteobacterium Delta 3]|nr:hypothetical protein D3OALGA1CA_2103 [Olavius algarvensis associated proteobacterium Delta 3]CAB5121203.1 hypothetical protein D3OALGB2SA_2997 [Olavius algarvensis associated proteobacterium Delta 3]
MTITDHHGSYRIERYDTYVRIRFQSDALITPELIFNVLEREFSLPKSSALNDLWDLQGSLPSDALHYDTMLAIVDFIRERYRSDSPHRKTAIVADQSASYGMARMFESLAHKLPYAVRIFTREPDALEWIDAV